MVRKMVDREITKQNKTKKKLNARQDEQQDKENGRQEYHTAKKRKKNGTLREQRKKMGERKGSYRKWKKGSKSKLKIM